MDPAHIEPAWADVMKEDYDNGLSSPTDNYTLLTESTDKREKVKVVSTYEIEKKIQRESIAKLLNWTNCGNSANGEPHPNTNTTLVYQEAFMEYLGLKKNEPECEPLSDVAETIAKFHVCDDEHLSLNRLYKDTTIDQKTVMENLVATDLSNNSSKQGQGICMLPSLSEEQKAMLCKRFDCLTVRISNLSEWMTQDELDELVKGIGPCKTYLALDRNTGLCKGFAYVQYMFFDDASAAIALLNGLDYNNLTLIAAYAKPSN